MAASHQNVEFEKLREFLSAREGGVACLCGHRLGYGGMFDAVLDDRRDVIVCSADRGEWFVRCEHRSDELLRLLPKISEVCPSEWRAFIDCLRQTLPRDGVLVVNELPILVEKTPALADALLAAVGGLEQTGQKIVLCGLSREAMRQLVRPGGLLYGCTPLLARNPVSFRIGGWCKAIAGSVGRFGSAFTGGYGARALNVLRRFGDWMLRHPVVTVGCFVSVMHWFFRFPDLNPEVWNDVAAAAGLRPPPTALGGIVRGIMLPLFALFPAEVAVQLIRIGGWLSGGLLAMLTYSVLTHCCGGWITYLSRLKRGRLVVRSVIWTATIAFVCRESVWFACQSLSATGLQLILAMVGLKSLLLYAAVRRRRYAFLSMAVFTVLSADVPFGLLGVAACAVAVFVVNRSGGGDETSQKLVNPIVRMTMRRVLTFIFLFGFAFVAMAEWWWLRSLSGYDGIVGSGLPSSGFTAYFAEWVPLVMKSASWQAWLLIAVFVVGPSVVTRLFRDRSTDIEDFVPTGVIVVYMLTGALAWSQLCGCRSLWITSWCDSAVVNNPLVDAGVTLLMALTLLWTMLVVGSAVFLKNPRKVAVFRYADAAETDEGRRLLRLMNSIRRSLGPVAAFVPFLVVLSILSYRYDGTLRGMLGVIGEYLEETALECDGAERVFTDWYLDAGLELEAFRRGRRLYTVALMGGNGERDLALRNRGISSAEDLKTSEGGVVNLLRSWVNDYPDRMTNAVVQLGFGLWRGHFGSPVYLGTVAVPPGNFCNFDVAACGARARELSERIVRLYEDGEPDVVGTAMMRDCFRFAQWRLSRLGAMRSVAAADAGCNEAAALERDLSDRLNAYNHAYAQLYRMQGRGIEGRGSVLTPREGLRLGLERADFKLARVFADSIIIGSPNDPEANFAIGMDHFLDKDYPRAEPYLNKCLASRPDDPAVLNNLAVIKLRMGNFVAAEGFARKALEKAPDSPQLKSTLDAILKAKKEHRRALRRTRIQESGL